MVSWKDEIVDPQNTTISQFGGLTINRILQYFKAVDLANNDTDQNGIADIATATIFKSEALKLWDSDKSHKIKFQTPDYTEHKTWTFPNEASMGATDEVLFKDAVAIVTGKTLDFAADNVATGIPISALSDNILHNETDNSLGNHYLDFGSIGVPSLPLPASGTVRLYFDSDTSDLSVIHSDGGVVSLETGGGEGGSGNGGFVAGGLAEFSGDASETVFEIPHTMDPLPDAVNVLPTSVDALGSFTVDIDTTNITITYQIAPPDGTDNLGFYWSAGYINEATSGFSPTTINTIQNKTINVDQNTIKNSGTNNSGDILVYDGASYKRFPRGTANQHLVMNSIGSNVQWTSSMGGGGGGGLSAGGIFLDSGTGSKTVFDIPHGLITIPDTFFAIPNSDDAAGHKKVTVDATNIKVTYAVAPLTGSNNVTFVWGAGFVGEAVEGFTPSSVTTLTNKTIGDNLKVVKQGSAPTNPTNIESSILYIRAVDADNNGLFLKTKKNNAMVEVQIV